MTIIKQDNIYFYNLTFGYMVKTGDFEAKQTEYLP